MPVREIIIEPITDKKIIKEIKDTLASSSVSPEKIKKAKKVSEEKYNFARK